MDEKSCTHLVERWKKVTLLSTDENISLMSVRMMYARKKNSKRLCMHCDQQERTDQKLENISIGRLYYKLLMWSKRCHYLVEKHNNNLYHMEHEESTFELIEYWISHLIIEPVDNLSLGGRLANFRVEFSWSSKWHSRQICWSKSLSTSDGHHKVIESHIAR